MHSVHRDAEDQSNWEQSAVALIANDQYFLGSFQALKYTEIALLTILLYDHCLTFNLERRRIWTLSWKLPKCLFMFNRYILPPVFSFQVISNSMSVGQTICNARIFTQLPLSTSILTVELMLTLRVLALYGNSTRLARFLIILFIAQWIIGLIFYAGLSLPKTRAIVRHDLYTGCLYVMPSWTSLSWIPLLILEINLAVLAGYKCQKYGDFSPTIKILARDSAIYFICMFSVIMANIFYPLQYEIIGVAVSIPTAILTSIAASRLSMNIRALTVERGISTLAEQSHLSTLFSFSSRNRRNAAVGEVGADSSTGIPARQGEEELEGGYYDDDEDDDAWFEERDYNEDDEIIQEDRNINRPEDVERAINYYSCQCTMDSDTHWQFTLSTFSIFNGTFCVMAR